MNGNRRIGAWATASLFIALTLVIIGFILNRTALSPFFGGLIMAFGEAGLAGGLADWFAVRALFTHPLGLRILPHTALIPRNRQRIIAGVRDLVQNQWLSRDMLLDRARSFDFVGDRGLAVFAILKPKLRTVLRTVAREALHEMSPAEVASFLGQGVSHQLAGGNTASFLAEVVRRVRTGGWLNPLLGEIAARFKHWAASPENRATIHRHLKEAANAYCRQSVWKSLTYSAAEFTGGVDLEDAAELLQQQVLRFADEQLESERGLTDLVKEGLEKLEVQLHEDPEVVRQVQDFFRPGNESAALANVLGPVVAALRDQGLREVDSEDSQLVDWIVARLEAWLDRLAADPEMRNKLNAWARRTAETLIEKHHPLIGALVEEQLSRLSDERLVDMIEEKVGEDLNWIRINGTLVGGCVGTALYLLIQTADFLFLR